MPTHYAVKLHSAEDRWYCEYAQEPTPAELEAVSRVEVASEREAALQQLAVFKLESVLYRLKSMIERSSSQSPWKIEVELIESHRSSSDDASKCLYWWIWLSEDFASEAALISEAKLGSKEVSKIIFQPPLATAGTSLVSASLVSASLPGDGAGPFGGPGASFAPGSIEIP